MSYDPQDFTVEWRDVGAGYLLSIIALLGLVALGSGEPTARADAPQPAYRTENTGSTHGQACAPARARLAAVGHDMGSSLEEHDEEHAACEPEDAGMYY